MKKIINEMAQMEKKYFTYTVEAPALARANLRVVQGGFVAEHTHGMSNLFDGQIVTEQHNSTALTAL